MRYVSSLGVACACQNLSSLLGVVILAVFDSSASAVATGNLHSYGRCLTRLKEAEEERADAMFRLGRGEEEAAELRARLAHAQTLEVESVHFVAIFVEAGLL